MLRTIAPPRHVRLAAVAAANGGPFSTAQAGQAGYAKGEIAHLVRSAQWVAFRKGIYVDRAYVERCRADETESSRRLHALEAASAALAVGGAVVSHESALVLFGLCSARGRQRVSLTRSGTSSRRTSLSGVTIRRAALPPDHITVWLGVPVTTPARTVTDLARTLPFREAVSIADAVLHARLTSRPEMHAVLADCASWPGAAQARRVLEFADASAESALESIGRVAFAEQGLPAPETQVRIVVRPGLVFRVDYLWTRFRTIAEADGLLKYSGPAALRNEKLRQEALSDLGYEVVRFTWKQLHEDPAGVAARIRRAFARASRHPTGRKT